MDPGPRIGVCGGLAVQLSGRQVETELPGRQGREVFAYLVLHRSRPVSRDELAALLWPDEPPRAPEAALNTILARLRRVVGHDVLAGRGQLTLELPPGSWIDIEAAEAMAWRADALAASTDPAGTEPSSAEQALQLAAQALDVVAAPLLPEMEHPWVQQRREELADLRTRLLTVTVRCGLKLRGPRLDDAERAARRVIEFEPFRESGYAMLMEVYAARGDVAEALLVYERLRALLSNELGVAPSARVAALHTKLLLKGSAETVTPLTEAPAPKPTTPVPPAPFAAPTAPPAPPPVTQTVALPEVLRRAAARRLVGRTPELDRLDARWGALASERRGVVTLAGESGIGKTSLAATFAHTRHSEGAIVLHGQAHEEAIIPYAPLVEALRHYVRETPDLAQTEDLGTRLGELGWLIPELSQLRAERRRATGDPKLERVRLYHSVAALVAHVAAERPLLLVLEDFQWADHDTLLMLRQLMREPTRQPVMVLVTFQDGAVDAEHPLSRLLSDLRRDLDVTRLAVTGLGSDAIGELFEDHERPSDEVMARLQEHTSGNPLFVEQVLRSVRDSATANGTDGELSVGDLLVLPEEVSDVIADRLSRLQSATREALAAASVLGQDFSLQSLEAVTGSPAVGHTLDAAVRAGLILDDSRGPGEYRFTHSLAREAIYHGIGRGQRAQWHLRAAQALERQRETTAVAPAELAYHYLESDRSEVADRAIASSREAAERARAAYAYDDAALHYRRAIGALERHRPQDTALRLELLRQLGRVCWEGGESSARVVFEQAVEVARGLGAHSDFAESTLGLGGRFYAPTGADEPYIQLLEEALLRVPEEELLRTRLLGRLAEHLSLADPKRALALSEEALDHARTLGNREVLAATLLSRHAALLHVSHLAERRTLIGEQVQIARAIGAGELEALGHHWLMYDLLEDGDLTAATTAHQRLLELSEQLRQPLYRHSALVWQRTLAQVAGQLARAEQLSGEALNLARSAHGDAAQIHFLGQQLSVVRDRGGSERLLAALLPRVSSGGPLWAAAATLLVADAEQEPDSDTEPPALQTQHLLELPRDVFWLSTLSWSAEAGAQRDDPERAGVLYECLLPYADRFTQLIFNGSFGCVHRPLGLLAAQLGRAELAAEHFNEAIRRHAETPAPVLRARTVADYAQAAAEERASASPRDIARLVTEARRLADDCAASRLAERLRELSLVAPLAPH